MLEVNAIDVFYGPIQALRGVSLRVEPGEMVALVGIARAELDRFLPPQPEGLLQRQAHPDMWIFDLIQIGVGD